RLAHNGEINTIRRLRLELPGLGTQPLRGASDTQDLDLLVGVLLDRGLALDEVRAMLLPPVQPRGPLDRYHRAVCGPLAQGPAALIGRSGELVVGGVDRLRVAAPGELGGWAPSTGSVCDRCGSCERRVSCGSRRSRACWTSASSTTTPCPWLRA